MSKAGGARERGRAGRAAGRPPSGQGGQRKKLSRTRKPEDMTLEEWQTALRREFGRTAGFRLKNVGSELLFSEFHVTNPETERTYRVAVRGVRPGDNYCSCPDFAVNALGTCKHIEFALARLGRTPAARKALEAGFRPPYTEIFLRYGARRDVVFRPGARASQPGWSARRGRIAAGVPGSPWMSPVPCPEPELGIHREYVSMRSPRIHFLWNSLLRKKGYFSFFT
jgi:hypothetical protein